MLRRIILPVVLLYAVIFGWIRTFGGSKDDVGTCVQLTTDNNYIVTGWTKSYGAGGADLWLLKVNRNGAKLWSKTYGGGQDDKGEYVIQTPDGGFLIVGKTCSYGAGSWDVWLVKTDSVGKLLWNRTYGGPNEDFGKCLALYGDYGYLILANTTSFGTGSLDIWEITIDPQGDTISSKTYGGEKNDWGNRYSSITNYIVGATESQGNGEADMWLTRNSFSKTFGIYRWEEARDAKWTKLSSSGSYDGYIIVGVCETSNNMGDDVSAVRINGTGEILWETKHGGVADDWANGVIENSGLFITVGTTYSYGAGGADLWLVALSANGTCPWKRTFGGPRDDEGLFISPADSGGCIITGYTELSTAVGKELWLIYIDSTDSGVADLSSEESDAYETAPSFKVVTPLGRRIVIQHSKSLDAVIYDATGREVEAIQVPNSGILTWGEGVSPGVYFITSRESVGYKTARVVITP